MAVSLIILADGPGPELLAHLGPAASDLYAHMLGDTLGVAARLPGGHVTVCHRADLQAAALPALPATVARLPLRARDTLVVAEALAIGLAVGEPAIVLGGNLPHLPLWRLRDAATYLKGGADLVLGPSDRAGWYLFGLRPSASILAQAAPNPAGPLDGLLATARGYVTHLLPPWFGISTVADLASLAETVRSMPPDVAPATRALLEIGQVSRAVGG